MADIYAVHSVELERDDNGDEMVARIWHLNPDTPAVVISYRSRATGRVADILLRPEAMGRLIQEWQDYSAKHHAEASSD